MLDFHNSERPGRSSLVQHAYAVDDHIKELKPISQVCRNHHIRPKNFAALSKARPFLEKATQDDVLIMDNRLDGVRSLGALGRDDIDTDGGNLVGLRVLTDYCDDEEVDVGLRILWSGYRMDGVQQTCERYQDRGVSLYAFKKDDPDDLALCEELINEFRLKRHKEFVGEKLGYVEDLFDEWKLSSSERSVFLVFADSTDKVWKAIHGGTCSMDVEFRCDLIHEIQLTLDAVYGEDNVALHAQWFRAAIDDLGGISPISFLGEGEITALIQLVRAMDGP
ncbi:hypothetical protein QTO30_20170 [Yoonia sp. GPGPB17]|uniref:hypothetical protein n=1 Tax=Yoonia sp. GPGPB17 TaxID=3026147 RepID=UPI0030BAE812